MQTPEASMLSAHINAIKGHRLSTDKRQLSLVLNAKHVGDLSIILSTEQVEQLAAIIGQVKAELPPGAAVKDDLKVTVPRTWLVGADLNQHDLVVVAFNQQTQAQTAYGLDPAAAKKLAEALVKNADAVLNKTQNAPAKKPPSAKH